MNSPQSKLESKGIDQNYRRNQVKSISFLLILTGLLIATILFSLRSGSYKTPLGQLIQGIFGMAEDNKINLVVQNNRLPRICAALLAGAGLGVAGCVLQAVLHNPLASASTLGVSQGASFGAAFAIVVVGLTGASGMGIPLFAFVGSIAVALLILALSKFRQISPEGIVLAGVAISSMFTGATTLIQAIWEMPDGRIWARWELWFYCCFSTAPITGGTLMPCSAVRKLPLAWGFRSSS